MHSSCGCFPMTSRPLFRTIPTSSASGFTPWVGPTPAALAMCFWRVGFGSWLAWRTSSTVTCPRANILSAPQTPWPSRWSIVYARPAVSSRWPSIGMPPRLWRSCWVLPTARLPRIVYTARSTICWGPRWRSKTIWRTSWVAYFSWTTTCYCTIWPVPILKDWQRRMSWPSVGTRVIIAVTANKSWWR